MARYIQNKYRIDHRTGYGDGLVVLSDNFDVKRIDPFSIALCTIRIARRLGILPTSSIQSIQLAYDQEHDNLLFPAPIASWIANTRIRYLRGWKQSSYIMALVNVLAHNLKFTPLSKPPQAAGN